MNSHARPYALLCSALIVLIASGAFNTALGASLNVPYVHQIHDSTPYGFNGETACGATAAVMIVAYWQKIPPDAAASQYGRYISQTYTNAEGYTFDKRLSLSGGRNGTGAWGAIHNSEGLAVAGNTVTFFQRHGLQSKTTYFPRESQVKAEIDAGRPVWASTNLTGSSGHIVVIRGYDSSGYYINDPWGDPNNSSYPSKGGPGSGNNVKVTWSKMMTGMKWIVTASGTITTPTVTIQATDNSATEPPGATDTGMIRFSRTGSTSSALTVNFSRSGNATRGTDYNCNASPITIPAGTTYVDMQVTPLVDANSTEGDETATFTVQTGNGYSVGSPSQATVTIHDHFTPKASARNWQDFQ